MRKKGQDVALMLLNGFQLLDGLVVDMLRNALRHARSQLRRGDSIDFDALARERLAAAIAFFGGPSRQLPGSNLPRLHRHTDEGDVGPATEGTELFFDVTGNIDPTGVPIPKIIDIGRFLLGLDRLGRLIE